MIASTSLFHANSNKTNNIQSDHQHKCLGLLQDYNDQRPFKQPHCTENGNDYTFFKAEWTGETELFASSHHAIVIEAGNLV